MKYVISFVSLIQLSFATEVNTFDASLLRYVDTKELAEKDKAKAMAVDVLRMHYRAHILDVLNRSENNIIPIKFRNPITESAFSVIFNEIACCFLNIHVKNRVKYNQFDNKILEVPGTDYKMYTNANWSYVFLVNVIDRFMMYKQKDYFAYETALIDATNKLETIFEDIEKELNAKYTGYYNSIQSAKNNIIKYFNYLELNEYLNKLRDKRTLYLKNNQDSIDIMENVHKQEKDYTSSDYLLMTGHLDGIDVRLKPKTLHYVEKEHIRKTDHLIVRVYDKHKTFFSYIKYYDHPDYKMIYERNYAINLNKCYKTKYYTEKYNVKVDDIKNRYKILCTELFEDYGRHKQYKIINFSHDISSEKENALREMIFRITKQLTTSWCQWYSNRRIHRHPKELSAPDYIYYCTTNKERREKIFKLLNHRGCKDGYPSYTYIAPHIYCLESIFNDNFRENLSTLNEIAENNIDDELIKKAIIGYVNKIRDGIEFIEFASQILPYDKINSDVGAQISEILRTIILGYVAGEQGYFKMVYNIDNMSIMQKDLSIDTLRWYIREESYNTPTEICMDIPGASWINRERLNNTIEDLIHAIRSNIPAMKYEFLRDWSRDVLEWFTTHTKNG